MGMLFCLKGIIFAFKSKTMIKKTLYSILTIFIISFSFTSCSQTEKSNSNQNEPTIDKNSKDLFIGTYTKKEGHVDGKADGIYWYSMNSETGKITYKSVFKEIINPSFLTLSTDGNFLYAVSETGSDVDSTGWISAFAINKSTNTLKTVKQTTLF